MHIKTYKNNIAYKTQQYKTQHIKTIIMMQRAEQNVKHMNFKTIVFRFLKNIHHTYINSFGSLIAFSIISKHYQAFLKQQ